MLKYDFCSYSGVDRCESPGSASGTVKNSSAVHKSSCCLHGLIFTLLISSDLFFVEQILQFCSAHILLMCVPPLLSVQMRSRLISLRMTRWLHLIRMSMAQSSWVWFTSCAFGHSHSHHWMGVVWLHWIRFLFLCFNQKWPSWQGSAYFSPFCTVKAGRVVLKWEVKVFFRNKPDWRHLDTRRHRLSIRWSFRL